ncbi:DMT family transporter [Prosthecomicrobium sp. N25]|uniref:DMT family transporter n=1 Tax=Prosthecomicrobium sp. N25 TaxID=3129254 RepID=UPI00307857FC
MRKAVLFAVLAIALLSAMDVAIKLLAERYPVLQVAFLRYAAGGLVASVGMALVRPGWPSRETAVANGSRALLVVVTATSFFYAISTLPLAEAIALSFVAPLLIALFGILILKEHLTARVAATLAIGFTGMLMIVGGRIGAGAFQGGAVLGVAAALLSALTYALSLVYLRHRAQRDPVITIVWFQNAVPFLILALPAALVWVPPAPADLALFAAVGLLGIGGHLSMARAFARAPAAALAPIEYTALVWGGLWGFLVFAELPTLATLAGASLIVAGTLWGQWPAMRPALGGARAENA